MSNDKKQSTEIPDIDLEITNPKSAVDVVKSNSSDAKPETKSDSKKDAKPETKSDSKTKEKLYNFEVKKIGKKRKK